MNGKVRCSHILQKHTGSRNPTDSYRNKKIVRSPDEALQNIETIRNNIIEKGLESFETYASELSECRSAGNKGDLGFFGKGEMQKEFEDVAFGLAVGDLSGVVSTESGYHIILRTA